LIIFSNWVGKKLGTDEEYWYGKIR
jgi:hypothetical protein